MANNLSLIEHKLFETDFFLDKIKESKKAIETHSHAEYYFSAFLSASRSITFVMQYAFPHITGFSEWYETAQSKLKASELAKFFVEARNFSQKRGTTHFNITSISGGETSFYYVGDGDRKINVKDEMVGASEEYFKLLLEVFRDFFIQFGEHVDPKKYYTLDKLIARGQTVKELEYEVWGYNKWSQFGLSDQQILDYITSWMYITNIDRLFDKYLKTTKPLAEQDNLGAPNNL